MGVFNALAATATVKLWPLFAETTGGGGWNGGGINSGDKADTWKVGNFLDSGGSNLQQWAAIIVGILGVIALLVAVYMLVTGLISHGKKQTSWVVVILLFVVGGVMAVGGWGAVASIGGGLNQTMDTWATGSGDGGVILPMLSMLGL